MASESRVAPPDLSTPVSLRVERWSCPWPPEADSERIDEQTVVIRVVVDPEGIVEAAELVGEPGHGAELFGVVDGRSVFRYDSGDR